MSAASLFSGGKRTAQKHYTLFVVIDERGMLNVNVSLVALDPMDPWIFQMRERVVLFPQVENVDFSQPVVAEMCRAHSKVRPRMSWKVMDVTDMAGQVFFVY